MKLTHEPHEQRVIDECNELEQKIEKLHCFIFEDLPVTERQAFTPKFQKLPLAERDRLLRQLPVMRQYSAILTERIDAFPLPAGVTRIPSIADLDHQRATSGTVELDALGKDKSNW
jgi:hypothetical protein